jgi:hypothetical protein
MPDGRELPARRGPDVTDAIKERVNKLSRIGFRAGGASPPCVVLGFAAGAFQLPAFAVQLKPDRIGQHQAGRAVWATVLNFDCRYPNRP